MLIVKIIILFLMAILNFLRGYHYRPICMLAMSFLMGLYFAFLFHTWWLFVAIGLPFYGCLSLSDSNRGTWCSIDALGVSFALLVTGHLFWLWFALYCASNYLIGWIGNNKLKLPQVIIDPLTGASLASIIFLI